MMNLFSEPLGIKKRIGFLSDCTQLSYVMIQSCIRNRYNSQVIKEWKKNDTGIRRIAF